MRAVLQRMPDEELDILTLTDEEFHFSKVDDHEIKANGKMYDIARVEKAGNLYRVYCLHDKDEGNLLVFLDKILNLPLKDKKTPLQILKFTSLTFILPATDNLLQYVTTKAPAFTQYTLGSTTFVPSFDSPPPKV